MQNQSEKTTLLTAIIVSRATGKIVDIRLKLIVGSIVQFIAVTLLLFTVGIHYIALFCGGISLLLIVISLFDRSLVNVGQVKVGHKTAR